MRCGTCGRMLSEDADHCSECETATQPATVETSDRDLWIIGCVVVLVLVVLAAGADLGQSHPGGNEIGVPPSAMAEAALSVADPTGRLARGGDAAEQAVRQVVLDFYRAWARGDPAGARTLSTAHYGNRITVRGFGHGYEQYDTRILDSRRMSDGRWQVIGSEVFLHPLGESFTQRSTVEVVRTDGGWLVSDWKVAPVEPLARTSASSDASFVPPQKTVENFFGAWRRGNAAGVSKLMTPELARREDISQFSTGYQQLKLEIVDRGRFSNTKWQVTVKHTVKPLAAGRGEAARTTRYRLSLQQVEGRWLVSDFWVVSQQQAAGRSETTGPEAAS